MGLSKLPYREQGGSCGDKPLDFGIQGLAAFRTVAAGCAVQGSQVQCWSSGNHVQIGIEALGPGLYPLSRQQAPLSWMLDSWLLYS